MSRKRSIPTDFSEEPTDRKATLGDALRRRILNMDMSPGSVVDEVALSEEFGLSRPPVRELLRQMAAEGYIDLEVNRAARVSSMSFQTLRSFFLAAPLVYIATTQLAAMNATRADIDSLKDIQRRFKAAIASQDVEGRVLWNDEFHLEIGKVARNPYLMPSLRRLLIDHARLGKIFYRASASPDMQDRMEAAVRQHDEIIAAIECHDADAAAALVRAHLDLSRHRMAEYAAPEGIEVPLTC
ncbi:MAG: hypothetical protein RL654_1249 [Pseudomonadota bacterium]|jgi:DNA-binding GntR family transcriptional regulator